MQKLAYAVLGAAISTCLLFGAGWLALPFPTAAASPKPACPWPASLDAVTAAPKNHRVLIENEHVRVLDVTVLPGERENLHAHCRPSVMYLMHEGIYKDYGPDGELLSAAKEAAPADQFPMTLWLEPQAPHAVENLDTKSVRLIRIELKDRSGGA